MRYKILPSFGYNAFYVECAAGETQEIIVNDEGLYGTGIYFFISGLCEVTIRDTGVKLEDRTPGWLSTERLNSGTTGNTILSCHFPIDTAWVCFPKKANRNGLPSVSSLVLTSNSNATLLNNSDILVCRGTLKTESDEIVGPTHIRVRSGDIPVAATTDVYALKFN